MKNSIAFLNVFFLLCIVIVFQSCTSSKTGIAPLYPAQNSTASSLQPTFEWKGVANGKAAYDLIIYETNRSPGSSVSNEMTETVYYKENLQATSHMVDGQLSPNKIYYWSVRTRIDGKTGDWSMLKTQVFTGVSYHQRTRKFTFTSPDISAAPQVAMLRKASAADGTEEISKLTPVPQVISPKESPTKPPRIENKEVFGNYHALVIGNNNYKHMKKLKTAIHDAEIVSSLLEEKYGFKVKTLLNANRYQIMVGFSQYRRTLNKNDNLLIYYAGHGWFDKETDEGYWIPIDGEEDNTANWISNNSISNSMKAISAKHILVVADSCYSGALVRGVRVKVSSPDHLEKIAAKRARTVLTSGGLEPVIDGGGKSQHSVFASAFLDSLSDNKDQVISMTDLFSTIRREVLTNADQTPEYSDIRKAGHEGGDFLFLKKN